MGLFDKSKESEIKRLRSAGLSLAHADRVAQGRRSSGAVIAVAGGVGVVLVGVIAALALQLDQPAETTATTTNPPTTTLTAPLAPGAITVAEQPLTVMVSKPGTPRTTDELTDAIAAAVANDAARKADVDDAMPVETASLETEDAQPTPAAVPDCVARLESYLAPVFVKFDLGSAILSPESDQMLADISDRIITCEDAYVMVAGHADSSGDDLTNMALSWERADRTTSRLIAFGVSPNAVEAVGFGARAPLSQGSDDEESADRRVDFRVLRVQGGAG